VPDKIGNLFATKEKKDRKYSKGGRLQEDEKYYYHYDAEGYLIFKEFKKNENSHAELKGEYATENGIKLKASETGWAYEWTGNGMLRKVVNPGGAEVEFSYDPLGRRIAKTFKGEVTRWVWDGNVPLHEWKYAGGYPPAQAVQASGELQAQEEPTPIDITTWVFDDGSFVPCAKLVGEEQYSIVADYLGTPTHAYNANGNEVWHREIDCYGKTRKLNGEKDFCPYLYQGQSVDIETGLAYNRFRYYDNESGNYISQDPIGLMGNNPTLYGYVEDTNSNLDVFGLHTILDDQLAKIAKEAHDVLRDANGNPTRGFNNSTVSVAEIEVNGQKQLIASGNGAKLTPAQRAKLEELGVPRENILSGKKFKTILDDVKATNLANHAERVIINNAPKGSTFTGRWGISWGGRQRNASCANCQPHVDAVSKQHH
jgi:RHS repeat-associated protein